MHPNRFVLEQFSVEDLPAAERGPVAAHVSSCAPCRALLDEWAALAQKEQAATAPLLAQLRNRRTVEDQRSVARSSVARRRWRRVATLATTGALLAAAWLFYVRPADSIDPIGWKGAGVSVQRLRDGAPHLVGDDGIRAGDGLRVIVTQPRAATVGAWIVDAHGRVDALLPNGPIAQPAGEEALPGGVVVEAPCVDSWLVVARGDDAGNVEATLRRNVAGGPPAGNAWIPRGALVQPLRCR